MPDAKQAPAATPPALLPIDMARAPGLASDDHAADSAGGDGGFMPALFRDRSFQLLYVLPVALYAVYILLIAAPVYLSEAKFVVRAPSTPTPLAISSLGMTRSSDETQIVDAFIDSRDLVQQLSQTVDLNGIYNRPESDFFSRLSMPFIPESFERLHRHFLKWATAEIDESTGITTVSAYGFRADDAHAVAEAILQKAEGLVNRLNVRAYEDNLAYAQVILDKARTDVSGVEVRLTQFRNATGTVDLGREATVALEMIGKMSTELANLEASLRQQIALAPNNPGIPSQQARIDSYKREIDTLRRKIVGDDSSMTNELGQYERLSLERMMSARSLESAITNMDKVRQQAQLQQFYLARISEPGKPETAEFPSRWTRLLIVAAGLLLLWAAGRAALRYVREHEH